jgi:hypothetical protein
MLRGALIMEALSMAPDYIGLIIAALLMILALL